MDFHNTKKTKLKENTKELAFKPTSFKRHNNVLREILVNSLALCQILTHWFYVENVIKRMVK